jgi:indole-3-glycerol phosphate synthase
MPDILQTIANATAMRVKTSKEAITLEQMKEKALSLPQKEHAFHNALQKKELSFICECKKASPSKGQIVADFPYMEIAHQYEAAGADAISVLTEPQWFLGSLDALKEISDSVSIPCLRKDFIIDEYMIYEARVYGADAILLIVSLLDEERLERYIDITHSLGMDALVECHDAEEVDRAKRAHARIIGVNNRNLRTFSVDASHCLRLRQQVGSDCIFVAESGIKTVQDIRALKQAGVDAVLIGETMMLAADKAKKLEELNG